MLDRDQLVAIAERLRAELHEEDLFTCDPLLPPLLAPFEVKFNVTEYTKTPVPKEVIVSVRCNDDWCCFCHVSCEKYGSHFVLCEHKSPADEKNCECEENFFSWKSEVKHYVEDLIIRVLNDEAEIKCEQLHDQLFETMNRDLFPKNRHWIAWPTTKENTSEGTIYLINLEFTNRPIAIELSRFWSERFPMKSVFEAKVEYLDNPHHTFVAYHQSHTIGENAPPDEFRDWTDNVMCSVITVANMNLGKMLNDKISEIGDALKAEIASKNENWIISGPNYIDLGENYMATLLLKGAGEFDLHIEFTRLTPRHLYYTLQVKLIAYNQNYLIVVWDMENDPEFKLLCRDVYAALVKQCEIQIMEFPIIGVARNAAEVLHATLLRDGISVSEMEKNNQNLVDSIFFELRVYGRPADGKSPYWPYHIQVVMEELDDGETLKWVVKSEVFHNQVDCDIVVLGKDGDDKWDYSGWAKTVQEQIGQRLDEAPDNLTFDSVSHDFGFVCIDFLFYCTYDLLIPWLPPRRIDRASALH